MYIYLPQVSGRLYGDVPVLLTDEDFFAVLQKLTQIGEYSAFSLVCIYYDML